MTASQFDSITKQQCYLKKKKKNFSFQFHKLWGVLVFY